MTKLEFLNELRSIKNRFIWRLIRQRIIATERKLSVNIDHCQYCPITAIYYEKFGRYLPSEKFPQAAEKLGIDNDDAVDIVLAADYALSCSIDLRKQLCEVLDLQ